MEIELGYGSYCKVSGYQEGLESSRDFDDVATYARPTYWENIHQWNNLDY